MSKVRALPKGRHSLSREEVASSQRLRLIQAAVDLGAEHGFATLTLADIVRHARVARSTFYEHFGDKQQCFLAAYDYAAERVLQEVLVPDPREAGDERSLVQAYMARMLKLCLQEPGLVRLVAADAEALGPAAAEQQRAASDRLAEGLLQLREHLRRQNPDITPLSHVRALAFVGALSKVLQHTFFASGIEALPGLQTELTAIAAAILEAPAG